MHGKKIDRKPVTRAVGVQRSTPTGVGEAYSWQAGQMLPPALSCGCSSPPGRSRHHSISKNRTQQGFPGPSNSQYENANCAHRPVRVLSAALSSSSSLSSALVAVILMPEQPERPYQTSEHKVNHTQWHSNSRAEAFRWSDS